MTRSFPPNAEGQNEFEMHEKVEDVELHSHWYMYFQTSASSIINFRYPYLC